MSISFKWKFDDLIQVSCNFAQLLVTSNRSWLYHYFWFSHMFKGDDWHISSFEKKKKTFKVKSFKLCMIITFLRVYVCSVGLMTLTLSHLCQSGRYSTRWLIWIIRLSLRIPLCLSFLVSSLCLRASGFLCVCLQVFWFSTVCAWHVRPQQTSAALFRRATAQQPSSSTSGTLLTRR